MCTATLNKELDRYINNSKKPVSERGKTHSFPDDLYLAGSDELKQEFNTYINDLIKLPKPPKKAAQEAYFAVLEQIILNLSRCLLTRKWLLIAGSNTKLKNGLRKFNSSRCHIFKSFPITNKVIELLLEEKLIDFNQGKAYDKGYVENNYFPNKFFAKELIKFSPFVEQTIKPPYLYINQPEDEYEDFKWDKEHPEIESLITINEYAKEQSWTLKAPIKQTFKRNPFTSGRLITPFQNLPSRDYDIRKNTLINGNPIVEVDFNANHLRIFLAFHKQPYQGSDPYIEIAEIAGVDRESVKGVFVSLLNCEDIEELKAVALKHFKVSKGNTGKIDKALKERFKGIDFYSKFGVHAMNYEGVILKEVLLKGIKEDIFMLPIHDAIAVQEHHKERANEIMLETWSEVVSEMCGQKVETVTKFE